MSVQRLQNIPGFNIDRVAAAAGDDPDVLRMENLDTDIPPPAEAMEATRAAVGEDEANSWLPACGTWHDPSLVRRMNPSLFACHEAGAERDAPAAGYPQSQAL